MAYCFKDHETISEGVKRIALEQLDTAIEQLQPSVKNWDEAIHGVRVSCKKLRALLRLALGTKKDPMKMPAIVMQGSAFRTSVTRRR